MVICKYYRQGTCRYGQYCQFEHINTFVANNKVEYNEDEYAAVAVAKEVLVAERGGQWLLSCFGPFRERPAIPGMEDLSPEEVRWEMYQAEKIGMVDQAKMHYQQLCQDMKAKRDALKNPTRETIAMLKKIMGTSQKSRVNTPGNPAGKPVTSSFSFASPQLGLPNSTSASNVFGNKSFGTQSNPFSGSFTSSNNTSIFGRPNTSHAANPIFGGTPSFNGNLPSFGSTVNTSSVFGGTTNTSTFNAGQNSQTFGSISAQSGSVFGGGTSQSSFGQADVFKPTPHVNNVFARPQTSQSQEQSQPQSQPQSQAQNVFNSGTPTSSGSLFSTGISGQMTPSIFGGSKPPTTSLFGGPPSIQPNNPNAVFGATTSSANFNSGIFSQSKSLPAFGGAPVFGGGTGSSFSNNSGQMFGDQSAMVGSTMPSNIFCGSTTPPSFSSAAQSGNSFGGTTVHTPGVNIFGTSQITTSNVTPFGNASPAVAATPPFITAPSQFEPTSNTTVTPFSRSSFGATTVQGFGTTIASTATPFGATTNTGVTFGSAESVTSPFTSSTFTDLSKSPFASTSTTVTTTTTNPFAPRTQQINSPFGTTLQNHATSTQMTSSSSPFGNSPFGSIVVTAMIDDSVYTIEGQLTDDEKSAYLSEKFTFRKIPLKPPTQDIK